jgi:radical SAM superfamily enzyme YgiQ (UPF0313 family)
LNKLNPKIVIATVPFVDEDTPLAAPAVLKSSLVKHGFECVAIDLNIEIFNKIQHHPNRQLFLKFFYFQEINQEIVDELTRMIDFYVHTILAHKPDIIGLSLFSFNCQTFTAWLCASLKHHSPQSKIVIGGPGLQTLENSFFKYPDRLKQLGLIDDYIVGDGDTSFVEYAKGNLTYPGINSTIWKSVESFDSLPTPDYSDYTFFHYKYPLLPIIDSRGCVQNCEFCDVISFWNKFQYRSADTIYNQILDYIRIYKIYRFQFSSSISNGNLREFKKLVTMISDYNKKNVDNANEQIHWIGSFIIRPTIHHKEKLYQLIKESNGFLICGVESIISDVRKKLGKNFDNDDLEYHLSMCKKYQIEMNFLLIAAYPTETVEDYTAAKQWFIDRKHLANDPIKQVQVTVPIILPGTELEKTMDAQIFSEKEYARKEHAYELIKVIKECGFNVRSFV